MIAGTITASTFIAAPLMFISAKLLMINNLDPADYIQEIDIFLFDIRLVISQCYLFLFLECNTFNIVQLNSYINRHRQNLCNVALNLNLKLSIVFSKAVEFFRSQLYRDMWN